MVGIIADQEIVQADQDGRSGHDAPCDGCDGVAEETEACQEVWQPVRAQMKMLRRIPKILR